MDRYLAEHDVDLEEVTRQLDTLFIDDGESLVNELTITDPVMFSEPVVLHQFYRRGPPGTRMLEYECTEGMWVEHERAREAAARERAE